MSSPMLPLCPVQSSLRRALTIACALLLVACASGTRHAPVEDRSTRPAAPAAGASVAGAAATAAAAAPAPAVDPKLLPGAENAGKPGYYTVKPGDTMIRIGLETGQNWRDLQRWNNLENPNLIEVGQVLRVLPPAVDAGAVAIKPVTANKVEPRSLDAKPATAALPPPAASSVPVPALPSTSAAAGSSSAPAAAPAPATTASAAAAATKDDDEPNWAWPAAGPVLTGYDEARNKGLDIGGKPGDPVLAAADGLVVYAGSGLRGYGNLVIVKHNATYLTAYAHNQTLVVKENQAVKRGQRIAEMGSTDATRVQLHFEIRKLGKPVDPARLLPPR
jgi:lipoprotein NlpD